MSLSISFSEQLHRLILNVRRFRVIIKLPEFLSDVYVQCNIAFG